MTATIVLQRTRLLLNSTAVTFDVLLDGMVVGAVRNGESLVMNTSAGQHELTVRVRFPEILIGRMTLTRAPERTVHVEVTDGGSVTVHCEPESVGKAFLNQQAPIRMWITNAVSLSEYSVHEVVETEISEEPIGVEHRLVQNPSGASGTRRIQIVREFARTMKVDVEAGVSGSVGASFGVDRRKIEGSVSAELKASYGLVEMEREQFAEELFVDIRPHASIRVSLHWKRIWQHGIAKVSSPAGVLTVPFRVVRALTFDQSIEDI